MEAADLSAPGYWSDPAPDIRSNPVGSPIPQGLIDFVFAEPALRGHVLVATSGSSGEAKWVALSKSALLVSAAAVNRHLDVTAADRWLCALPDFHVGGIGVYARANQAGAAVLAFSGPWRGRAAEFAGFCTREAITQTSLAPTQVFDLVAEKQVAPRSLRAVVVGGARLEAPLRRAALDLGWPVRASYGMTEAGSQIATAAAAGEGDWLPVLPHWEVSSGKSGRLRIRGAALFSGTVVAAGDSWSFLPAPVDAGGWYETQDRVELRSEPAALRFLGRSDDLVKKLGELVSLEATRRHLAGIAGPADLSGTVVALPDDRLGCRLVAVFEGAGDGAGECVRTFNESVPPFARLDEMRLVAEIPRTSLGKVAWGRLEDLLQETPQNP